MTLCCQLYQNASEMSATETTPHEIGMNRSRRENKKTRQRRRRRQKAHQTNRIIYFNLLS